jgi:hypothetical protein
VERLTGQELPEDVHRSAAEGLHWAYGTTWPTALALIAPRLRLRHLGDALCAGAALGTAVWAIGYVGWLPAAGLTPGIRRQGLSHSATALLGHIPYGIVSVLPLLGAQRLAAATDRSSRARRR